MRINLFALFAGLFTFYLALIPEPWWIISGGSEGMVFHAHVSPFTYEVMVLGKSVDIPIIYWINIACRAVFIISGVKLVAASIMGGESSRWLLDLKPFWTSIFFPIALLLGLTALDYFMDISVPIQGEAILTYGLEAGGYHILAEIPVNAHLTATYWIVLAAGILSLAARTHPSQRRQHLSRKETLNQNEISLTQNFEKQELKHRARTSLLQIPKLPQNYKIKSNSNRLRRDI